MHRNINLILLTMLFASAPILHAVDGDGYYVVTLEEAVRTTDGSLPMKVYLERREGKFREGFAVAAMRAHAPCGVDCSGLTLEQGALKGALKIGVLPVISNTDPISNQTWTVDAKVNGDAGSGTYTHPVRGQGEGGKTTDRQDRLTIEYEALAPYPATTRVEAYLLEGLKPGTQFRDLFVQFTLKDGKATEVQAMVRAPSQGYHEAYSQPQTTRSADCKLVDGELTATIGVEVTDKMGTGSYELTLKGRAIAGRTFGTATITSGGTNWVSTYSGRMIRSAYQPPTEWKTNTWAYKCLPMDTNLEALAKAEALVPVRPGEPGKTWFGAWPNVLRGGHNSISAPAFGFHERAGAVKYKYVFAEGPVLPVTKVAPLTGVSLPKEVAVQEWDGNKTAPGKWMGAFPEWGQSWMPEITRVNTKVFFFDTQEWGLLPEHPEVKKYRESLPTTWVPTEEEWGIPGVTVSGVPGVTKLYPIAEKDFLPQGGGLALANLVPAIPTKFKGQIGGHQWAWKRRFHAFLSVRAPLFLRQDIRRSNDIRVITVRLNGLIWPDNQVFELAPGLYVYAVEPTYGPNKGTTLMPGLKVVPAEDVAKVRAETERTFASALSFEADKPWRPLTPIWDRVQGGGTLTVLPLDKDGNIMPGPLDYEVADRDGTKMNDKVTTIPMGSIRVGKKAPFQGPYFKPLRPFDEAALKSARFLNNFPDPNSTATKEMTFFNALYYSGEGTMFFMVHPTFYSALYGSLLTKDPMEKKEWREMYEFAGEALRMQTRNHRDGLAHCYASYTFLNHFVGDDFLNLYQHTGGDKWREAAAKLAESLVKCQMRDGSWNAVMFWGHPVNRLIGAAPANFFGEVNKEFDPSGVVRFLGRVRRDLKTEKFWEAEKKAYQYVMDHSVKQMLWVAQGEHSMEWAWPPQMHGIQAQQFCLYLLDYAKPEQQDLKLVEDLMRWSEDLGVSWSRPGEAVKPGGRVYPYESGGRPPNSSSVNNMESAIIYLKLYRQTKNPLHKAKSEALANAVLVAQDAD